MPVFERSQTRYRPLAFTDSPGSGSLEHFHHFMWSYFLPAFSLILDDPARKTQAVCYQLASCGPLMDRITRDILTTTGAAPDRTRHAPHVWRTRLLATARAHTHARTQRGHAAANLAHVAAWCGAATDDPMAQQRPANCSRDASRAHQGS